MQKPSIKPLYSQNDFIFLFTIIVIDKQKGLYLGCSEI